MDRRGPNFTAGRPSGSIVSRFQPLPFTLRTSVNLPSKSFSLVLTDVLPPP